MTASSQPPSARPQRAPLPPSPCVGICALKGDYCYGCGRTGDEIAVWGSLSPAEQSTVWAELPARLAAFGFKTFRLAAGPTVIAEFIGRSFRETTGRWRVVSASVEADMLVRDDARPTIVETATDVTATSDNGDVLRLTKHEKVRIFGFASQADKPQMDTVVLVLPKGRADRDLKVLPAASPDKKLVRLPVPETLAEAYVESVEANATRLATLDWPEARPQLTELIASSNTRAIVRNAIGDISTTSTLVTANAEADANAPADLKISRAFVACAVFRADDPDWLARALAP